MYNYNNNPFAEGARQYPQALVQEALQKYLAKCIQNNHHCARCVHNHGDSCFFAMTCFATDQKFYQEKE